MRTPTFKMHGSKSRLAPWVVGHFPKFRRLIEPFAGRGNIFFRACGDCSFEDVLLNDLSTHPFLEALRDYSGDWAFVDEGVLDKKVWEKWKTSPPSHERALAESYVARFGNTFSQGAALAGGDSRNRHSRKNTILRMQRGGELLREKNAQITGLDWAEFLLGLKLDSEDLVYLDPPYDVPQAVHYKNIDQDHFLEVAKSLSCQVYISGYTSERYEKALSGWGRDASIRTSSGKGSTKKGVSGGVKPLVEEVLWWNRVSPEPQKT